MFELANKRQQILNEINDQRDRLGTIDPELLEKYDDLTERLDEFDNEVCEAMEENMFQSDASWEVL